MIKKEVQRLRPALATEGTKCLAKIKTLGNYKPSHTDFTLKELTDAGDEMTAAQEKESQAEFGWKAARDQAVAAEWAFHNKILGAKKQVVAQFGVDSDEVNAVGLKKKSEYKRSGGRKPKTVPLDKAA